MTQNLVGDLRLYSKSKLELNSKKVWTRVMQKFFFSVYFFLSYT